METYQLVENIKNEYDQALFMYKKGHNDYWFGRCSALGELLDRLQKERTKPYKSCKLCSFKNKSCFECFR
jgi:hypothetical protein